MALLTGVYAFLFYSASLVLVCGLAAKVVQYARTPAPLKIPTTPAPTTQGGVVLRMARELVLFESLFRANKWTWAVGWGLHLAMVLIALRHLRYFMSPVPALVQFIQPLGIYAGFLLLLGLAGLWARRMLVDRVRYCSAPSDHLLLGLLALLAVSGLSMTLLAEPDIGAVKLFFLGLYTFQFARLPADPLLLLHLSLAAGLILVFPFSKLLHAPGLFFSPTRNQVDDAREQRHVTPWASRLAQR